MTTSNSTHLFKHSIILFTVIVLSLCCFKSLKAHHTWGGTMSYVAVSVNQNDTEFRVTMQTVLGPEGASFDNPAEFGVWRIIGNEYEFVRKYHVEKKESHQLEFPEHDEYQLEKLYTLRLGTYEATIKIPNDGFDYVIGYRRCCRSDDLTNIYDEDSDSPFEPGSAFGITISSRAVELGNSSPQNELNFDFLINLKQPTFEKDLSYKDIDGDSLVYTLSPPRIGGGIVGANSSDPSLIYACNGIKPDTENCPPPFKDADYMSGYDHNSPFGFDANVQLSSSNGLLQGDSLSQGLFVVGITVSEYRNGDLLGNTYMDYTYFVAAIDEISKITGTRFFDSNENGVWDDEEPTVTNLTMEITPTPFAVRYFSNGEYAFYVSSGQFSFSTTDTIFQIGINSDLSVDSTGTDIIHNIPFVTDKDVLQNSPNMSISRARCNETADLTISILNSGSVKQSGLVTFTIDSITTFYSTNIPNLIELGNHKFQYSYTNLHPFASIASIVKVSIPGEEFLGDTMYFEMSIQSYSTVEPTEVDSSEFSVEEIFRCGFDPNQKYTYPNRGSKNITYFGERVHYNIAFQNLGNDTVFQVRIGDHLSHNLDMSTLRFGEASHDYECEIKSGILTFILKDVDLLPASVNSKSSNGFISFSALPISNLLIGTKIYNHADIYFDSNNPFRTNSVTNTIGLPYTESSESEAVNSVNVLVFPNPSSQLFQFVFKNSLEEDSELFIFDLAGRLKQNINVSGSHFSTNLHEAPGVYYYLVVDSNGEKLHSGKLLLVY